MYRVSMTDHPRPPRRLGLERMGVGLARCQRLVWSATAAAGGVLAAFAKLVDGLGFMAGALVDFDALAGVAGQGGQARGSEDDPWAFDHADRARAWLVARIHLAQSGEVTAGGAVVFI